MRWVSKIWAGDNKILLWMLTLLLMLAGSAFTSSSVGLAAPAQAPPGPDRYSVITVDYTIYYWWMIRWGEDDVECKLQVDHEGLPTPGDIYVDCGEAIYDKWITQKPCTEVNPDSCKGFYLVLVDSEPAQKEVSTKLPPPIVQVTLEN